jgi:hypothetical protein
METLLPKNRFAFQRITAVPEEIIEGKETGICECTRDVTPTKIPAL